MQPRLTLISLGVADPARAKRFYRDGLGWPLSPASTGDFSLFVLRGGIGALPLKDGLLATD